MTRDPVSPVERELVELMKTAPDEGGWRVGMDDDDYATLARHVLEAGWRAPRKADFTHGSSGYTNYGCRCDVCKEGHRQTQARTKASRVERLRQDPTLAPHGRASTYGNYGCRCRPCTDAWAADINARRARARTRREDAA